MGYPLVDDPWDLWWFDLPPKRREQIFHFLGSGQAVPPQVEVPGQVALIEIDEEVGDGTTTAA